MPVSCLLVVLVEALPFATSRKRHPGTGVGAKAVKPEQQPGSIKLIEGELCVWVGAYSHARCLLKLMMHNFTSIGLLAQTGPYQ